MALTTAVAAVLSAAAMLLSLRREAGARRRAGRRAYVWLAVGVVTTSAVAIAAGAATSTRDSQTVALVFAAAGVPAVAPFVAGLLSLLGPPPAAGLRVRLAVDGLITGACVFFVGWIAFAALTAPDAPELGLNRRFLSIAVPAMTAACVVGLAVITAARAVAPRRSVVLAAGGCALATTGLLAGVLVCCFQQAVSLGTTLVPVALGYAMLAASAWFASRGEVPETPVLVKPPQSTVYAFVGITAVIVGCVFQILTAERFAPLSALTGCLISLGLVGRLALALRDVHRYAGRLEEREARFRDMAFTDPLTGLANRRALIQVSEERPDAPGRCSLIALDLDGFKNVNDIQGHEVGDAVLAEVGRRLRDNVRPGDLPVRLGGDEFAVLADAPQDIARQVAGRLLTVLSRPYAVDGGSVFLSASMGLAGSASAPTVEGLLRNADLALRYAKQSGKNRVELYDATYDVWLRRRILLEQGLRRAIERDELSLSYQPVVRLPDGVPVGVEALLRWRHPDLGSVPPDEFIPVAEEIGQIAALGRWAAHHACHQLSRWLHDGHDLWLAINVSVRELRVPAYAEGLAEVLQVHRVPPDRLVVEVTEQSVASDFEQLSAPLRALREAGVRVALDDFGSGYSSLGRLRRLPVDVIKIDRALVVEPGLGVAPLVDVCVRLGERLGLQVVAEGVEDDAQRSVVEEAGCRFGQGYLFGRAMPAEHVEALLASAAPLT